MSGSVITVQEILRAAYPQKAPEPFKVRAYNEKDIVLTMEQIAQMTDFDSEKTYRIGNLTQLNYMPWYSCFGYDDRSLVSSKVYEGLIKANPLIGHVGDKSYEFFFGLAGFKNKRNLDQQAQEHGEKSFEAFWKKYEKEITTFTYPLEDGFKIIVSANGSFKTVDGTGKLIYEREGSTLFVADGRTEVDLSTDFLSIFYNFPMIPIKSK